MDKAMIYNNLSLAGILEKQAKGYRFSYADDYLRNPANPSISLTLPRSQAVHESPYLFAFFFNMLSEGVNLDLQSRSLKIDEQDYFQLLLATAHTDTIGAVRIEPCPD
ncbi:MAG: HipA N-terminal domain-containing protein [Bacteroidota bacterium]